MKPTKEPGPFMKIAIAKALGLDRSDVERARTMQESAEAAFYRRTLAPSEWDPRFEAAAIPSTSEPERVTKEELRWGWPVQGSVS